MKTFEELKEDLLERAKKHNACQDGYRMGLNAKSKKDLLEAITSNWFWVFRTSKMIDANYLEDNFSEDFACALVVTPNILFALAAVILC